MKTFQTKTIEDIPVAYVAKNGQPASVAGKAFWELEQKVPLKGNRFYGVYDENVNEYKACVAISDTNREAVQDLSHGIIQGGLYAHTTLMGSYSNIVRQIPSTFKSLVSEYTRDKTRPCVEFYKRHTEVILMFPITHDKRSILE
ncbi:MAG TPA: GyrI-like domain-containing protein [Candidatus Paceibacterota bacterium]